VSRLIELNQIYIQSLLTEALKSRIEKDYPERNYSAVRFTSNPFRIRAIEIWEHQDGPFFRIYHAPEIAGELKEEINKLPNQFRSTASYTDFRGNFFETAKALRELLISDSSIQAARRNAIYSKNSMYDGLELPDVDIEDDEILGRVFSWREIIAINEEGSGQENRLRTALSQPGVYLQRSVNGASRYVGSAYGEGGIFERWLKHLTCNGNARHLNLFVLENGYSNILFTVLEITDRNGAVKAEQRWKQTLGSKNNGPYDGIRLNNN
jgi:hypothetical protein